jgi:glyoxylase-like metal-dependent hydrolase (beta-lactamase superfamily II)
MNHTVPISETTVSPPEPGTAVAIRDGLLWTRIEIPFPLKTVNVWLFDEGDQWTVIDTGCGDERAAETWALIQRSILAGKPIGRLIVTHGHVDHVGSSGAIVERYGARFLASLGEWSFARLSTLGVLAEEGLVLRHFLRHGCSNRDARELTDLQRLPVHYEGTIPSACERIRDGDRIMIGGNAWQAIITGGHASEHVSLFCAETNEYIAGDQILPRITPIIGVYPDMPLDNPLGDYLGSFERLAELPEDVQVLPSHGVPFRGLHERIAELQAHHESRLAQALTQANDCTAYEIGQAMFPKAFAVKQGHLAVAETLAHLNFLVAQGRLTAAPLNGVIRFGPG